ncbi:MAG: T9SS type A sorting domain-containing protein [Bacteroidota bacterium]
MKINVSEILRHKKLNVNKLVNYTARIFLYTIICFLSFTSYAANYYIDSVEGSDANDGSLLSPWQSMANINNTTFMPGDSILFRAGQSWVGTIIAQGSGTENAPIVIGRYGDGENPILNGNALTDCTSEPGKTHYCTIYLFNQDFWVIRDLEITNYDSSEEGLISLNAWEANNVTDYVEVTEPSPYTGNNSKKSGILIEANDKGAMTGLQFLNLEIHGINGDISDKDNGGIFFEVLRFESSDVPSYFEDVRIENCHIHDVDRTGISNWSYYDDRELRTNINWTPNKNFIIRNTIFERTGANALIVRVSDSAIIEGCLFNQCSIKGSGNAAFNFNTDNTVWQFNEFTGTKANVDDVDAGGVDSDFRSKNTLIQYNYSHDNDFGMLVTGGAGRFNDSTIVRYNLIERDGLISKRGNDGKHSFRVSGSATNTLIHNNVIYQGSDQTDTKVLLHKGLENTNASNTRYYNNIFYVNATGSSYEFGNSRNNSFSNNIFFGNDAENEPVDENKVTSDPRLTNPGSGKNGYLLLDGSSAIGAGRTVDNLPEKDFYNNPILEDIPIDIGIHQVSDEVILSFELKGEQSKVTLHPNPVIGEHLVIKGLQQDITLSLHDIQGNLIHVETGLSKGNYKMKLPANLNAGIYLLSIATVTGEQLLSFKILKI